MSGRNGDGATRRRGDEPCSPIRRLAGSPIQTMIRTIALSFAFLVVPIALRADIAAMGLDHLDMVYDARTRALPFACAYTDDVTAVFVNPAGLGRMGEDFQGCFGGGKLAQGISPGYIGVGFGTENVGHYALLITYTGYGKMVSALEGAGGEFIGYGESFTPYDYQFMLGAGTDASLFADVPYLDSIYAGAVMKKVSHGSLGYQGGGVLFDFGLAYGGEEEKNKLGVSVHNLGKEFLGAEAPLLLRAGWASQESLAGAGWLLWGLQGEGLLEGRLGLRVGAEYRPPFRVLALRLGYVYDCDLGGVSGLAGGFGVDVSKGMLHGMSLDYAIQPFGDLGFHHTISFKTGLRMKRAPRAKRKEKVVEATEAAAEEAAPAAAGE